MSIITCYRRNRSERLCSFSLRISPTTTIFSSFLNNTHACSILSCYCGGLEDLQWSWSYEATTIINTPYRMIIDDLFHSMKGHCGLTTQLPRTYIFRDHINDFKVSSKRSNVRPLLVHEGSRLNHRNRIDRSELKCPSMIITDMRLFSLLHSDKCIYERSKAQSSPIRGHETKGRSYSSLWRGL